MMSNLKERVLKKLEQVGDLSNFNVTLLPDFFLDHIIKFKNFNRAIEEFNKIYNQGGGNLPVKDQLILSGGNAANTALALAKLGIKSHLIAKTSELGMVFVKEFLDGVDISRVKTGGELSTTVSLEFEGRNVMLSYAGSLSNFSFGELDKEDLDLISSSDIVCVANWTLNKRGTELAEKVFSFAKENNVRTFFDMGDPSSREEDLPELVEKVLSRNLVDVFSLNENELRRILPYFGIKIKKEGKREDIDILEAGKELQKAIHSRVDIHTKDFTVSMGKKVATFENKNQKIATGAGDAWNAGDIVGDLIGLRDDERLFFANAVAACYLSSSPYRPNLDDVKKFLMNSLDPF